MLPAHPLQVSGNLLWERIAAETLVPFQKEIPVNQKRCWHHSPPEKENPLGSATSQ